MKNAEIDNTIHGRAGYPYWLFAAAVLAYLNALAAGFQFDDFNVIVDNPAVHALAAWLDGMPGIRPLLKLSYTLNWLADPGPAGFHAVNLLLHLVNVALVWRLTEHLPAPAAQVGGLRARILATLLFALHPIQTESVTYVSGRSMSLMAVFGLAGLVCWLEAPARARPRLGYALAGLLLAAAVLTKEVAVALPLTLLLLRPDGRARLAPLLLAGLALAVLFGLFGYQHLLTEPMPRGLAANLLSEANAVYYLLGQLFQPHALNIDPELPELAGWSLLSVVQVAGLAAAIAAAWLNRRRRPWLTFAVAWFIILLLPTHSLIPRLDLASERHLYLAVLGPFWLAAVGLAALPGRTAWRLAAVALAVAGITFTHLRNQDYHDEISLWHQTTTIDPANARAWNNLGWAYHLAGEREAARQSFQRALAIEPGHDHARRNLDYLDEGSP
ncbi:MAG: tetratricopeptide repeat protein [Gallionellaceae bacterium]|nr:tetratricopeptide repeat protein [Gallionellaceae bacterium]